MMRRILISALITVLLCGCTARGSDFRMLVDQKLSDALSCGLQQPSFMKDSYAYYVSPYIGRIDATATSNTFSYNGTQFVMNLRVPDIINRKYYSGGSDVLMPVSAGRSLLESSGQYEDYLGIRQPYSVRVSGLDTGVLVETRTAYMDFSSVCRKEDAPDLIGEILKIARTVKPEEEQILSLYSTRESISFTGETITLFENIAPENGSIEELFIEANSAGEKVDHLIDDEPAEDDYGIPDE